MRPPPHEAAYLQAQPLAHRHWLLHAHAAPHVQALISAPAQPHDDFSQRHSFFVSISFSLAFAPTGAFSEGNAEA
jgi:hypothetical protein